MHKHAERIEKLLAKDRLADAMYAVLRADKAEPMLTRMVKRYRHLAAGSRLQMRPSAQMRDGQTRDGQNAGTNAASHRSRGNNTMPSTSVLPPALRTVPLLVLTRARVWNVLLDKLAEYGMYEEVFKIVKLVWEWHGGIHNEAVLSCMHSSIYSFHPSTLQMHRRGAKATADTHTLMFKSCARHLEMQPPFVGVVCAIGGDWFFSTTNVTPRTR